ncbi:MAG: sugar ABC transporter permease [Spirochaetales bacterium]|nr:sugar ABC transporter permease [Spirochaetales bacterium]
MQELSKAHTTFVTIRPYVFIAPAILLYLVFFLFPLLYSFVLSFHEWNLVSPEMRFLGFDNYRAVFRDRVFYMSLKNTFVYVASTVLPSMAGGLILACLVENTRKTKQLYRAVLFLPVVVSMAVATLVWMLLLSPVDGMLNSVLKVIGLRGPNWLNDPSWSMASLVLVGIWKNIGYIMVLYIAGLKGIDTSLYESAVMDGAGWLRQFRFITLPMLLHLHVFVMVVSIIQSFQVFATVHVMTKGGPNNSTNMLVYQVWQETFQFFDIGKSSALSVILFLLVLAISIAQLKMMEKNPSYHLH